MKYQCEPCKFETNNKIFYNKHIKTAKHNETVGITNTLTVDPLITCSTDLNSQTKVTDMPTKTVKIAKIAKIAKMVKLPTKIAKSGFSQVSLINDNVKSTGPSMDAKYKILELKYKDLESRNKELEEKCENLKKENRTLHDEVNDVRTKYIDLMHDRIDKTNDKIDNLIMASGNIINNSLEAINKSVDAMALRHGRIPHDNGHMPLNHGGKLRQLGHTPLRQHQSRNIHSGSRPQLRSHQPLIFTMDEDDDDE